MDSPSRVIKENDYPIRAIESVGRNLLRIVDQMPHFYPIGIASALISKKESKRLGDFVAGTIVVHEGGGENISACVEDGGNERRAEARVRYTSRERTWRSLKHF